MSVSEKRFYEFGLFRIDCGQRALLRNGDLVPLAPKAFDTLLALVESEGRILEKEELLKTVWPDSFVEEGSLAQNISTLRKTLGEGIDGRQYIQTIPKRGYRFVAPVVIPEENGRRPGLIETAVPAPRGNRRYAVVGAAAALLLVGGALLWWPHTRQRPLTDQDVLVLADFANATGDPAFDSTLRDALAYQLEQSPFLKVMDDARMREDLPRMRRSPQDHITNDVARDICIREYQRVMLEGAIVPLGKSYTIELKATNCQDRATIARAQGQAADKEHVLDALAKSAKGIRAKLGESLASIEKLAPPVEGWEVTTGSLDAFRSFHAGAALYAQGRFSEAIPVLERATQLDPDLAFGWYWLASAYRDSGSSPERVKECLERAWALRDRVSAYERLWLVSFREGQASGEYVQDLEEWARTYPRNPMPHTLLGRLRQSAGEFEKALPEFQQSYHLYELSYAPRAVEIIGLVMIYGQLGRFDEAKSAAEHMLAHGQDAANLHWQLLAMAYAQDDEAGARKQIEWFAGNPEEYRSLAAQGAEARARGRLRESRMRFARAAELARVRNLPDAAAGFLRPDAGGDALVGNCAPSRNAGAVSETSLDRIDLPPLVPVNHTGDAVLALCGTAALAAQAEELNTRWVSSYYKSPAQVPVTRAAAALGLGHPDKAVALLEQAAPFERGYPMANYIRGLAYLRLGRGANAVAEFQKILDHRGANWGPLYPLSSVGVARGAALAGDKTTARRAYESFFALWKDADPDVPVLIRARQEYARLTH